jgi:2,3-bisphosphoglycerate-dependent phosphoglycerate mutase
MYIILYRMKIYILRHEDRTQDCSFFAPLTKGGLDNSVKLVPYLEKIKIDQIYSSPFIRTLQTIYPYAKEHDKKINIEYGLSELHNEEIIAKKAVGVSLPEYLAESFNYNPEYKSLLKPTDILYPEKGKQATTRIKRVLKKIIQDYGTSDLNIILVSHQTLCNGVLKIVNKYSEEFKEKLSDSTINNYEKGKICLIFDSEKGWTYKPVN